MTGAGRAERTAPPECVDGDRLAWYPIPWIKVHRFAHPGLLDNFVSLVTNPPLLRQDGRDTSSC